MLDFLEIAWQTNKIRYTHSATFIISYNHTDKLECIDFIKTPKNKL